MVLVYKKRAAHIVPIDFGTCAEEGSRGNKPPQLLRELIEFFTKPNGIILDPFIGVGGTGLGAHLAGRRSLNIELNPASIAIYNEVSRREGLPRHQFINGDCRQILASLRTAAFDFIATDSPYSPELKQTMAGLPIPLLIARIEK